jgi:uncharacterized protein (DUF58 family)
MVTLFRRPLARGVKPPLQTVPSRHGNTVQHTKPVKPRELPAQLLRRIEFKVLKRLDGFLFGDYTGVFYGPSLDLAEVREYQPGDEVRRMDWNVTARSGRLHVRQYREEREVTVWMIVDLSGSMNFGTRRVLKRDQALEFAALVAMIVTRKGDKVGAVGVCESGVTMIPPGNGRNQALKIVGGLMRNVGGAAGKLEKLEDAIEQVERTIKRRGLLFVISDFISGSDQLQSAQDAAANMVEPAWVRPLGRLAQRHDVIAVRVVDPAERELPKVGGLRFRDPETGREVWIDTNDLRVRAAHAALVKQRDDTIHRAWRAAQVDSFELSTDQDIIKPILRFAAWRKGRRLWAS